MSLSITGVLVAFSEPLKRRIMLLHTLLIRKLANFLDSNKGKSKMENQTQTIENTTSQNLVTPAAKTAEQIEANNALVKAMLETLERTALTSRFHETKGLRVAHGFAGKFVANLANNIAKAESTKEVKVSAVSVLNDFRNSANYVDNKPAEILTKRLTANRVKYYQRMLGKQYGCELSAGNVFAVVLCISDKIFNAIGK